MPQYKELVNSTSILNIPYVSILQNVQYILFGMG